MRRFFYLIVLVLGLALLVVEPISATGQPDHKVASRPGVTNVIALLSTERISGSAFLISSPCEGAASHPEVAYSINTTAPRTPRIAQSTVSNQLIGNRSVWVHEANEPFWNFLGKSVAARATTQALPKLQRIHSVETLTKGSAKYDYDAIRKMSTDDIVKSLRPGAENPLKVGADGRVFDGNTRLLVLEERGFDVNSLPRVPYP